MRTERSSGCLTCTSTRAAYLFQVRHRRSRSLRDEKPSWAVIQSAGRDGGAPADAARTGVEPARDITVVLSGTEPPSSSADRFRTGLHTIVRPSFGYPRQQHAPPSPPFSYPQDWSPRSDDRWFSEALQHEARADEGTCSAAGLRSFVRGKRKGSTNALGYDTLPCTAICRTWFSHTRPDRPRVIDRTINSCIIIDRFCQLRGVPEC